MRNVGNQLEYSMDANLGSDHFGDLFCGKMRNKEVAVKRIQLAHVNIDNINKFKEDFVDKLNGDHPHILHYLFAEKHEHF